MSTEESANKQRVRGYFKAFASQDRDWLEANVAASYTRNDTTLPFEVVGPDGVMKLGDVLLGAFSEVELEIEDMVEEDDKVVARLHFRGVHSGPYGEYAATGKRFDVMVLDFFRMEDGKIAEQWPAIDNMGLAQQIGMISRLRPPMDVTFLFVPGDRPERFAKALASGADRAILDLEDAVRPEAKAGARAAIAAADLAWSRVLVRINDAASDHFGADLDWLADCPAAAILVPKAEDPGTLDRVRRAAGRDVAVIPQIETALGLQRAVDLLSAPFVPRAAFGHLDFALDLGIAPEWDALAFFRAHLVMQSRLAGAAPPIDSVTPDLRDTDLLERESRDARRFGFGGKLLIHPAQVAPVARIFAPGEDELAWARRVVSAVRDSGAGAVSLDGKMIDKPVEDAARRILARAGE